MRAARDAHEPGGVWPADPAAIDRAGAVLRGGGLVAFPTETVYGLGANAQDPAAVARIFEAKGRPQFDPLIVHLARAEEAWSLAATVPDAARRLAEAFWPGPMTLVLEKSPDRVPDLVTSGLSTVALRVPGHHVARAMIDAAGVPVAAPSANRFGGVSPTRAEHVAGELGAAVDLILDGGPCETGVESTVIALTDQRPAVLRLGGTSVEQIEALVGPVSLMTSTSQPGASTEGGPHGHPPTDEPPATTEANAPPAPGMLDRHYAPGIALTLVDAVTPDAIASHATTLPDARPAGLLLFTDRPELARLIEQRGLVVERLSPDAELHEAAANLFAAMRRLEQAGVGGILAERVPDRGLGRAINDRLTRAAR